jgi:hypothetical protein
MSYVGRGFHGKGSMSTIKDSQSGGKSVIGFLIIIKLKKDEE